jgi:hypothetical protein
MAEKDASSKSCSLTSGAFLLTVLRWSDSSHFLNPEGSLPCSQDSGHWPISFVRSIQSTPSHPVSLRSALIFSFLLRPDLQNCLFPSGFLIETLSLCVELLPPYVLHAPLIILHWIILIVPGKQYRSRSSLCNFFQSPVTSSLSTVFSNTLSRCPSPSVTKCDVRGFVHHSTIHKEKSNTMQQCIKIYYSIFI